MSEPIFILGIAGRARSGKDTIARHLVEHHGFTRIALADSLRALLGEMDGPTWELRKELQAVGLTSRWALQTLGTECREALPEATESLWCLLALAKIRFLAEHAPTRRRRFVVPDIRFPHEPEILAHAAHDWSGRFQVWMVHRNVAGLNGDAGRHKSEASITSIKANYHVENNGTLADLRSDIDEFARRQGWAAPDAEPSPVPIETILRDWCNAHPDEAREEYAAMNANATA